MAPAKTTLWSRVVSAMQEHFHQPDVQAARAFYAAIAAHSLPGQPVWPMIVAPPGCGKTELFNPLHGRSGVQQIDSLTPNTFISGRLPEPGKERGKEGLLERVGNNGIILYPDFSTILAMQSDKRGEILSQMRRIYDGRLRREFGAADVVNEWEGRLTFGVAATPAVDRYYSIFSTLGERFVMIRWHRIGGIDAALKAMDQNHDEKNAAMRAVVNPLLDAAEGAPDPSLTTEIRRAIAATAEIAVRARTFIKRERRSNELEYVPEAEGATRLAQQLCQLAKGSARLDGRATVNDDDVALVHRVAFDCMPTARAGVLRAKLRDEPIPSMADETRKVAYLDLTEMGLLKKAGSMTKSRYELDLDTADLATEAGLLA